MGIPKSEWSEPNHPGYGWKASYPSTYEYFFTNQGFTSVQASPASMWQAS
ncbi:hypothetical protein [Corallococcus carmarthensis]|nr:hypothetical protein [Corallococcus carmarthensis]